ncbi:MAG: aspartate--tRNA(Asn) ligase [Nitrososphaeria archaeon]|nr:aspartate--tRNA(Asn) ligase [Nitrososphaeria archaeon]
MEVHRVEKTLKRILIRDILRRGETKENSKYVYGWVHAKRDLGGQGFLVLRDRSGDLQVLVSPIGDLRKTFDDLNIGDVIRVRGSIKSDERAPGEVELIPVKMEVVSLCRYPPPLPLDRLGFRRPPSLDKRLDFRYLDLRNKAVETIFKTKEMVVEALRKQLRKLDFVEVHTPKIVKEATEGGTNLFAVEYFAEDAYLAQSPQFYKQMLMASGLERVYEIAPAFRAERHNTVRHLNEFISVDLEIAFIESEKDVMRTIEKILRGVLRDVGRYIDRIGLDIKLKIPKLPFPEISMDEAYSLLEGWDLEVERGQELTPEGEKELWRYFKTKEETDFFFLTEFPRDLRPLYLMTFEDRPEYTRSFDLFYKGLEIVTGGQRIHDYETLKKAFEDRKIPLENYQFYLDAFRYGMPPHGGLGLGLERLVQQILDLKNIRETVLFPRDRGRLVP